MELLSLDKFLLDNLLELKLVINYSIFQEDIWCIQKVPSNQLLLRVSTNLLDKVLGLQLKILQHNSIQPNINQ